MISALIIIKTLLVIAAIATGGRLKSKVLRLGYMTGSDRWSKDQHYRKPGQLISGAITLATERINADLDILPYHHLEFVVAETYGQEEESIRQTVLLMKDNISAFIGPQETCDHEARIAAAFNMPMISYFCADGKVSDKSLYPTFVRTKPHDSQISLAVVSVLLKFDWTKVVFLYDSSAGLLLLKETILSLFKKNGIHVTSQWEFPKYFWSPQITNQFRKIVQETMAKTRVYVMLAEDYEFFGLLLAAKEANIVESGEYVIVGVEATMYDPLNPDKYIRDMFHNNKMSTELMEAASAAAQCFLLVTPAPPVQPHFTNFSHIVNEYLEYPPFNFTNKFADRKKSVRPEAAYLYDAVWLYAQAAHRALTSGQDPSDGRLIMKHVVGTSYLSAMGYNNYIDGNGDAQGNFTLLSRKFNSDTQKYGMYPTGTFVLNHSNTNLPDLELLPGENGVINWIKGRPPRDEPICGFKNDKCIDHTSKVVAIGACAITLIIIGIIVLVYRNWRYEQELASLLWKIDSREIQTRAMSTLQNTLAAGLRISGVNPALHGSAMSLNSQMNFDLRQIHTLVGQYRNSVVAIKMIDRKIVDLTRSIRKEFKIIRELRHDNLNTFLGACVEPGNVCILTEYCSRGSLRDVLDNDDIKLDNVFISSLVMDAIRGMIYIHDSEIYCHGRLKTSNCVVDSRWVLKITDYGLSEFKASDSSHSNRHDDEYYKGLYWTAPEQLRASMLDHGRPGYNGLAGSTPKGDIYSFSIILHEMYSRVRPYSELSMPPKEVIGRLCEMSPDGSPDPLRPRLSLLSETPAIIVDCMTDCWSDNPASRPDFKTIRRILKPMQRGLKSNIFDNMIAMLEKYSSNLEDIVEDRTGQLREEKKRTDELLYRMLPISVAEQLKKRNEVEAEAFDSVTIYFSDICGFTEIGSSSTPMQIVELLNDLYTTFDSIIDDYEVYKVETIGDAYMVVSGLPARNGIRHAGEIASMSLHLLSAIRRFEVRIDHRKGDTLMLRIGIHSGSCVAGVVGKKMPRYCLFGDTVNTASRMESNGQPLRIHCSEETRHLLEEIGGYEIEERGMVHMKGLKPMRTFWLNGLKVPSFPNLEGIADSQQQLQPQQKYLQQSQNQLQLQRTEMNSKFVVV